MIQSRESRLPEMITLVGLDGTGKGHLAAHLKDEHGYLTLGASDIIRQAISERPWLEGLHLDEATRKLKEELGATFITNYAIGRLAASRDQYSGLAIDGVRRLPEIENFKRLGGKVLHIHADPEDRFKQLVARGRNDAPNTIKDMLARDTVQLNGTPGDVNGLKMQAIIDIADGVVENRFDFDFHDEAIEVLRKMMRDNS